MGRVLFHLILLTHHHFTRDGLLPSRDHPVKWRVAFGIKIGKIIKEQKRKKFMEKPFIIMQMC